MTMPPPNLRRQASCWDQGLGEARVILAQRGARMSWRSVDGLHGSGLDFVTQDCLGLAAHPALREAAVSALRGGQVQHPAGSAPQAGLSEPVLALEARLSGFLNLAQATTFGSGAEANRAAMRVLLGWGDHLVVDAEAHPAFAEAARAQGAAVHRSPPGSAAGIERRLHRLRREKPRAVIVVAVSAVSATAATWADLPALVALCRAVRATLVVDVAHDLGAMGPTGRGVMELEGCLGRVDVVTGSLAKTFGATGGFVASRDPTLRMSLRLSHGGQWQSAALAPLQAEVLLAAFDLVESAEGAARRRRLIGHAHRLRNHLAADGWALMGREAPFVPVRLPPSLGPSLGRSLGTPRAFGALTNALQAAGMMVGLLQAPLVAGHAPRWRLHLRADHSATEVDSLATALRQLPGAASLLMAQALRAAD